MKARVVSAVALALAAIGSTREAMALLPVQANYGNLNQVINTICITCATAKDGPDTRPGPGGPLPAPTYRPPVAAASTRYVPSAVVSSEVKATFVERAAKTAGPEQAKKIAAAFASLDVPAAWGGVVASDGLHLGDVADAMTSYYVANWVVANQADNTRAQALAVRENMRRALAGPLSRVSNADRQRYAESLMLGFLLTMKPYADARKNGDTATARKLSDRAEANFLTANKTDLRRLSLTDRGFVPRT